MSVPAGVSVVFRTADAEDRAAVLALAGHSPAASTTDTALGYFLRLAFERPSNEARLLIAERDGAVAGFVLFGEVAGSVGTARLHHIAVARSARRESIGVRLCESAMADVKARSGRLMVAEVPDDEPSQHGRALLARCEFVECARVSDYYRDGVDLVVLQRLLDPAVP